MSMHIEALNKTNGLKMLKRSLRSTNPLTRWIGTDEYEIWNERDLAEYEKRVAEHEEMNSQPLNKRLNSITPKHSGIIDLSLIEKATEPVNDVIIQHDAKILSCSWGLEFFFLFGHGMTIVDFAAVIRETPKCVECVLIGNTRVDGIANRVYPDASKVCSKKFLLRKGGSGQSIGEYFVGSYPFRNDSKCKGYFTEYDEKEDRGCYENHDD